MKINLKTLLKDYGVEPGTIIKVKGIKHTVNDDLTYGENHKDILKEDFEVVEELTCSCIECAQCPIKVLDCKRGIYHSDSDVLKDIVNYLCKDDPELKDIMLRRIENETKRSNQSI